jgi:hypothetical protein
LQGGQNAQNATFLATDFARLKEAISDNATMQCDSKLETSLPDTVK